MKWLNAQVSRSVSILGSLRKLALTLNLPDWYIDGYGTSFHFDFHLTVWRDKFLKIKPTRCTNFSNLFWNETLHFSDSSSVHHQEFFTVHTAMVYVSKPVRHIPLPCVQWKTPDDGQRNSPKHVVSFQNKFEKLVHLGGFILRNKFSC
jgi:hypothetical protein